MLALMSAPKPAFPEIDNDKFETIMKISNKDTVEQKKDRSNNDADPSRTLQLLRVKGFPRLLPEGIQALVSYCQYLQELSLSYSFVSDELLLALSAEKQVQLETLRLEAHPETKPLPRVSDKAWFTFSNNFPNINLVLLSYMTNEDDQTPLIAPYVPITHLYFGEAPSEATVLCIADQCPQLVELVIAAYGPGLLDDALLSIAEGCPRLNAVGLGDCEITCSGLLEFVTRCAKRLQILYVWETSLVEDSELDVTKVSKNVSLRLGRTWVPEYIPLY
ncbi:F-box/LRR-repeat protein 3-like [Osmia bicornis bicornis]|uniref:F-box/LRR-repeat protein 3-like n=1 Tax=Osmia bicornis bicornis TaxID=1437191 RepID=UPI0010F4895B|nr:F-box/LRR-repeat protein 3-like [Osmia bicornis bicornis]XP_029040333.1 F-box/LRR-repeat protein 3-like [Osmia bicornis bicornis]XP_029040334.1 F-box/LRR-repeat protein 3-like [Osmia bicornis bicornis]XP_029040336.1 F-box/LRR-repeat protein 3-like [Osmia bicornis bicornis]XP_029040337.1 F-box/LRR-repeat protein 3-like [Osmia bicornis bicornis]XP_046144835.1 F-box/LRR-repeat protein 3-like [Osmia bicornis bicornis]XP_046144844.1 F-box/LRR-repeat protein 3-like [Osmia bicornis bicornis]XP_0